MDARSYFKSIMYTRKEVDDWFRGKAGIMEKFDGELGWLFRKGCFEQGVDGSMSIYGHTANSFGSRCMMAYADKPCRINTYGNSFTHCSQVNDGETWQERLASHLCEPICNFGIGGYSVYQSYRRMKREEKQTPAEYIVFNIFDDDHYRNLAGWRNICEGYTKETRDSNSLSPSLPYVKANPVIGEFIECENPCPTQDSVYNLCDLNWLLKTFKDDFVLRISLARKNIEEGESEDSYNDITKLATIYGINTRIKSPDDLRKIVNEIYTKAALYASMRIVDKIEEFRTAYRKKILYILSYCDDNIVRRVNEGQRFDEDFINYLNQKGLPYVDLMEAHLKEFVQFNISIKEYLKRYYIGHYNPQGNLFMAFAVKNKLVEMLHPKPTPYQQGLKGSSCDFY